MSWAQAARTAAMAALRGCRTQSAELFQQQTRKMGKHYRYPVFAMSDG